MGTHTFIHYRFADIKLSQKSYMGGAAESWLSCLALSSVRRAKPAPHMKRVEFRDEKGM